MSTAAESETEETAGPPFASTSCSGQQIFSVSSLAHLQMKQQGGTHLPGMGGRSPSTTGSSSNSGGDDEVDCAGDAQWFVSVADGHCDHRERRDVATPRAARDPEGSDGSESISGAPEDARIMAFVLLPPKAPPRAAAGAAGEGRRSGAGAEVADAGGKGEGGLPRPRIRTAQQQHGGFCDDVAGDRSSSAKSPRDDAHSFAHSRGDLATSRRSPAATTSAAATVVSGGGTTAATCAAEPTVPACKLRFSLMTSEASLRRSQSDEDGTGSDRCCCEEAAEPAVVRRPHQPHLPPQQRIAPPSRRPLPTDAHARAATGQGSCAGGSDHDDDVDSHGAPTAAAIWRHERLRVMGAPKEGGDGTDSDEGEGPEEDVEALLPHRCGAPSVSRRDVPHHRLSLDRELDDDRGGDVEQQERRRFSVTTQVLRRPRGDGCPGEDLDGGRTQDDRCGGGGGATVGASALLAPPPSLRGAKPDCLASTLGDSSGRPGGAFSSEGGATSSLCSMNLNPLDPAAIQR